MLAVAGGKGGCGKTTTALCLGRALPGETRVIDADAAMPNLHAMAGVAREPSLSAAPGDPGAVARDAGDDCRVVPAPIERPRRTLTALPDDGVATLLDCPAGAGPDAAAPLRVADAALLVATPCAPALRGAAKTGAMARALGCRVVGCLLTRARTAPPGVTDLLDCPALGTVPPASAGPAHESTRVREAYRNVAQRVRHTQSRWQAL
ncbi:MAG: MinD/ParA family protein [Halolamina sp.]